MKKIDPFYWLLTFILRRFINSDLRKDEQSFVLDNINKHRVVLWLNAISIVFVVWTLRAVSTEKIDTLIMALLAPVMVMGGAWFAVSFGGIPAKLINVAMSITFWMFLAFSVSLSTMLLAVGFISPLYLWPILVIVYLGAIISCIQYDTADGLKAGLDEAQLKHSRVAVRYYRGMGISDESDNKQGGG